MIGRDPADWNAATVRGDLDYLRVGAGMRFHRGELLMEGARR